MAKYRGEIKMAIRIEGETLVSQISDNEKIQTYKASRYKALWDAQTIDRKPVYQRPYWYFDKDPNQWGVTWQKDLIRDFLSGVFIQPLHLRKTVGWEIIDGGHRSRTIMNFLTGYLKTPADFILEFNGKSYKIGSKTWTQIINEYVELVDLLDKREFLIVEYYNMTDKEAEEKFLTLNDLHNMTGAEKRNAKRTKLANMCRELGAVDRSPYPIFNQYNDKHNLLNISVESIKRITDEIVSTIALWKYEGIDDYKDGNAGTLESFYNDSVKTKSFDNIFDIKKPMYKDICNLLQFTNDMVLQSDWKRKQWKKMTLLKMSILIDFLQAHDDVDFDNSIINWKVFCDKIDQINSDTKMKHIERRRYNIGWEGSKAIVEIKSTPKNPNDTEFGMQETFTKGNRVDDIEFWLYNVAVRFYNDGDESFGIKKVKDTKRNFSDNVKRDAWVEAKFKCEECDKSLTLNESQADHLLPHSKGGKTEAKNLQILCEECNESKSSSFTSDDLRKFIEKSGVKIDSDKVKQIAEIMHG
tara:strand:+ start:33 stop:1610 length:1578 start_codon:yes stop_codon:yes gene_type:complete